MNGEELLKRMDLIDSELVEAAQVIPHRRQKRWIKWCSLVAAAAAVMLLFFGKPEAGTTVNIGGIERIYKTTPTIQETGAPVYPWEYLTEIERFTYMELNGTRYRTRAATIDRSFLGDMLGDTAFVSYDIYTEKEYRANKAVYAIQGIDPQELVAVELENAYCVFMKEDYSPPRDLGVFLDSLVLSENVDLNYFILYNGQNINNTQTNHILSDDSVIWEILSSCRNTPCLEMERWYDGQIESVSFSVTSEKLGVYKHGFQISSDGYLSTNLMEWGYVFYIGEDAARQIIDYAKSNSMPTEPQTYYSYLYGTYVGIEDGYLLIDDTILCVNEKDGMIFRIPADDIRISRVIDLEYVKVGDVVLVSFIGSINKNDNTVSEPVSLQKGILYDGSILIEE